MSMRKMKPIEGWIDTDDLSQFKKGNLVYLSFWQAQPTNFYVPFTLIPGHKPKAKRRRRSK